MLVRSIFASWSVIGRRMTKFKKGSLLKMRKIELFVLADAEKIPLNPEWPWDNSSHFRHFMRGIKIRFRPINMMFLKD